MKYWLVLLISLYTLSINATSWWHHGYVITNDEEKIYGQIYVPPHSQTTGGVVISGIDLEGFYSRVLFKEKGFKADYSPDMIREFGFSYKGTDYKFESNCLHYKSIIKSERTRPRFLNVVHRGSISLLRDSRMLQDNVVAADAGRNDYTEYLTYHDFYLYSSDGDLVRLFSSRETNEPREVLKQLGMDKRFLKKIVKINVRDLKDILYQYDLWLSEQDMQVPLAI